MGGESDDALSISQRRGTTWPLHPRLCLRRLLIVIPAEAGIHALGPERGHNVIDWRAFEEPTPVFAMIPAVEVSARRNISGSINMKKLLATTFALAMAFTIVAFAQTPAKLQGAWKLVEVKSTAPTAATNSNP